MSVARQACAAVCIDGNVHVVGGYAKQVSRNLRKSSYTICHASVERYDPVANEWRTLPNMCMGAPRTSFAAAVGEAPHFELESESEDDEDEDEDEDEEDEGW
jgi:hypothetical protein